MANFFPFPPPNGGRSPAFPLLIRALLIRSLLFIISILTNSPGVFANPSHIGPRIGPHDTGPSPFRHLFDPVSSTGPSTTSLSLAAPPTAHDMAVCFVGVPVSSEAGPAMTRFLFDELLKKQQAGSSGTGGSKSTSIGPPSRRRPNINIDVFFAEARSHAMLRDQFGFRDLYDRGWVKNAVHEVSGRGRKFF